jgi:hypothetical protein
MRKTLMGAAALSGLWIGMGAAQAAPGIPGGVAGAGLAQPVAMCGYTCRNGGRYIPGPPSVCAEEGLRYCGPSGGYRREYYERRRDWDDDDYEPPRRGPGIYFGIR